MGQYQQHAVSFVTQPQSNWVSGANTNQLQQGLSNGSVPPWSKPQSIGGTVTPLQQFQGPANSTFPSYGGSSGFSASHTISQSGVNIQSVSLCESRYEPLGIQHRTLTKNDVLGLFCMSCNIPMISKIRLTPCFHMICLECFKVLYEEEEPKCPVCYTLCDVAMPLHTNDTVHLCSGFCSEHLFDSLKNKGKVFLNNRSLRTHNMFFHSNEKIASPDTTITPNATHINTNTVEFNGNNDSNETPLYASQEYCSSSSSSQNELGFSYPSSISQPSPVNSSTIALNPSFDIEPHPIDLSQYGSGTVLHHIQPRSLQTSLQSIPHQQPFLGVDGHQPVLLSNTTEAPQQHLNPSFGMSSGLSAVLGQTTHSDDLDDLI